MDIKGLREKLGMTQEQLAREVGVSFKTVNRWERGKSKPSPMASKILVGLQKRCSGPTDG